MTAFQWLKAFLITASRQVLLGGVTHYILGFPGLPENNFCYMMRMRADGDVNRIQKENRNHPSLLHSSHPTAHARSSVHAPRSLTLIPNTSIITATLSRCLCKVPGTSLVLNKYTDEWMNSFSTGLFIQVWSLQPICQHAAFLIILLKPSLIYSKSFMAPCYLQDQVQTT